MNLLIVTGLSGAGKSLAMHALEDIGFFCIDNQSEQAQAYVELYRALGGGWTPEAKDKEDKNG